MRERLKPSNHFVIIYTGLQITQTSKHLESFFRSYSELLSFGEISFQEYVSYRISHPVFHGDLVYRLRRHKGTVNCVSSGSKYLNAINIESIIQ